MREHERESARDDAFEALLAQSVAELPPEEIVADVTPVSYTHLTLPTT